MRKYNKVRQTVILCLSFFPPSQKNTARPADWKYQSSGAKWVRLDSHMNLDIHFAVPNDGKSQNLMKQLQVGLWSVRGFPFLFLAFRYKDADFLYVSEICSFVLFWKFVKSLLRVFKTDIQSNLVNANLVGIPKR